MTDHLGAEKTLRYFPNYAIPVVRKVEVLSADIIGNIVYKPLLIPVVIA